MGRDPEYYDGKNYEDLEVWEQMDVLALMLHPAIVQELRICYPTPFSAVN